jgi:hypothetical protein
MIRVQHAGRLVLGACVNGEQGGVDPRRFPNNWPQQPRLCTNPNASGLPRQAWDWFHHQRC